MRFLKIFIISFIVIFAALNGRFLYANLNYWFKSFGSQIKNGSPISTSTSSNSTKNLPDKAILVIEKIGVSTPIVFGVNNNDSAILNNLENGVVHYSNTPKPGLAGVSIILGHSSAYPWYKGSYGSVFALLGKLNPGDRFSVQYNDGQVFNFVVRRSVVFSPFGNDARLTAIEKTPGSSLVLISCWPIGTNYKRIAIQAELI